MSSTIAFEAFSVHIGADLESYPLLVILMCWPYITHFPRASRVSEYYMFRTNFIMLECSCVGTPDPCPNVANETTSTITFEAFSLNTVGESYPFVFRVTACNPLRAEMPCTESDVIHAIVTRDPRVSVRLCNVNCLKLACVGLSWVGHPYEMSHVRTTRAGSSIWVDVVVGQEGESIIA